MSGRVHVINGRFARFMRSRNWAGLTLPWFGAPRILMWGEPNDDEVKHELSHAAQIVAMGRARWVATILWQYLVFGYRDAPLEIQARREAGQEDS